MTLFLLGVITVVTFASMPAPAFASVCPNESIREQQGLAGLALPDCRAYEVVSPGSAPYINTGGSTEGARASNAGDAISYFTRYPAATAEQSGFRYLATRGPSGWSVEEMAPQDSPSASALVNCYQALDFSPDLSSFVLSDGWDARAQDPAQSFCGAPSEPLTPDAPEGYGNLFLKEGMADPYRLINFAPEGVTPANATFQDATPSLGHILFTEEARLTSDSPTGTNLFEWSAGAVHLVTYLPDGNPVHGDLADGADYQVGEATTGGTEYGLAPVTHAMSADGERVYFYAEGGLYVRMNATQPQSLVLGSECLEPANACTIEVDASQGPGSSGGGQFWDASESGSRVYFADESRLTANSNAVAGKPDLYEYDLETRTLTDLTPGAPNEPADVRGYSGASEDGTYLYFVALGALTGAQQNALGATAEGGEPNLYLLHDGSLVFIATLSPSDSRDWQEEEGKMNTGRLTSRVAPAGRFLGFDDSGQIDLYDAARNTVACASCAAAGSPPPLPASLPGTTGFSSKSVGRPAYLSATSSTTGASSSKPPTLSSPRTSTKPPTSTSTRTGHRI